MNNENQINDPMGNHSQPQNPFSAPVEPQPAQPNPFGAQAGAQPQPAQPNPFGAQAGAQPQPAQPNPFGAQAGVQPQPAQPSPFGAQAGAQPQPAQPSPFGAQMGAQPQPAQPSPFGAPTGQSPFTTSNTFANQKMGGAKMKKPTKLGWSISLVALVLSIIGIVIGWTMFGTGIGTVQKNIDNDTNSFTRADIDPETYIYSGLTKGKEYYMVLTQEAGPELVNIKVDGNQLVSFVNQKKETSSGTSTLKIFRFVASSSEAKVEISGVTKTTDAGLSLVDGEKYGNLMTQMAIGLVLVFITGFTTFISAIVFIVFLIVFLVKNSKYKNAQRNITMA